MHIQEVLKIAIDNIDEVISIIRREKTVAESKQALIGRFEFSDAQGQAIVDLPLGRLSGLEIEKIVDELERLKNLVEELTAILADPEAVNNIIKDDLLEIKRKYGDERRTEILPNENEIILEDLIEREECVVTITEAGYIKRQPASVYQAQRRGGKGVTAMGTKEDDFVTDMFASNSHDVLLMFTNKGRVYEKRCYEIPVSSRISKGMNIVNLLELNDGETLSTIIPVAKKESGGYLVMVTRRGLIKRTRLSEYSRINRSGKIALNLDDGDELAFVARTGGGDEIFIAATNGQGLKFNESVVRVVGRTARGVRAIRLASGEYVTGVTINPLENYESAEEELELEAEASVENGESSENEDFVEIDTDEPDEIETDESEEETVMVDKDALTILTITKNGFGKRCEFGSFTLRNRGGKGMKCHRIDNITGSLIGAIGVRDSDDIMIITDDGTMIRTPVSGIPVYVNRSGKGVKVMRTAEGVAVKTFVKVAAEEKEDEDDEELEEMED
jgi:DNA gyrase subunit A